MASKLSACYAKCRKQFKLCGQSEQCKAAFVRCIDLCTPYENLFSKKMNKKEQELFETIQDMQKMMKLKTKWYEELLQKFKNAENI